MFDKPHILSLFLNSFYKFNNTRALMQVPLFIAFACILVLANPHMYIDVRKKAKVRN